MFHKRLTISLLYFTLVFSCQSKPKLKGHYASCHNGLYSELWINQDSLRLTTSMEFLSDWRKYEIKNDSFYFSTFGTPELRVAKINFLEDNSFELIYSKDSLHHVFKSLNISISNKLSYEQYFEDFYKRGIESQCLSE